MTINQADFIEGLAKGLGVLEVFDTDRQRLNAALTAERTGLTRTAARRYLLTLKHLGYLESDDHYYWLAPRVLRMCGAYLASARLPRVLQPTLDRLAEATHKAFSAVVLDGAEVVIVARSGITPTKVRAYGLHLGARLPAHATSTGRVLLAALQSDELDKWFESNPLVRFTSNTQTEQEVIRTHLSVIRKSDKGYLSEEHEIDIHALAVPLRNIKGETVAALNVVASISRTSPDELQSSLLPLMLEAAREVRGLL